MFKPQPGLAFPYLIVNDGNKALDYYKMAFGGDEVMKRMLGLEGTPMAGKLMHGEIQIGKSVFFITEEWDQNGYQKAPTSVNASTCGLSLYFEDVDKAYERAMAAPGTKSVQPPANQFWGDRMAVIKDPFGHVWMLHQKIEELTEEQIEKRAKEMFANFDPSKCAGANQPA